MQEPLQHMTALARQAQKNAYAPYSKFYVGACIRTMDDQYFVGCNYENASYPLTHCAEAVAVGNMVANGIQKIKSIVIIGSEPTPCSPCGACRQILREFMALDAPIYFYGTQEDHLCKTLDELLPHAFGPRNLEK